MARSLIVGLGREGLALTRFLRDSGADVTVCDGRPASELGAAAETAAMLGAVLVAGNDCPDLEPFDTVYVNPAVPKEARVVQVALARGIRVSALTDVFFDICPAPIAGITGSNGKTTTTTMLGLMAEAGGLVAHVGGNIGRPLLNEARDMRPTDWVILEMSSFQLEWLAASPRIAVVTNVTPNHLDRHKTMNEYAAAKLHIVQNQHQSDLAVLNAQDAYAPLFARSAGGRVLYFSLESAQSDGAVLEGDMLCVRRGGFSIPVCTRRVLRVPGLHNVANALAAITAADEMGVEVEAMRDVLHDFSGVSHRLELVRILDGVRYYNDSIATTPDRAQAALDGVDGPVVLILGGHDKDLPWQAFCRNVAKRARAVLLIGEAQELIAAQLEEALAQPGKHVLTADNVRRSVDLEHAVADASAFAQPGDVVLLSPGCASYDQFSNFEARGARFRELVGALGGS